MKVYIDGKEVVAERWRTAWNPNSFKFEAPLKQGKRSKILIDWYPDGDVSYCGLRAAVPQSEEEQSKLRIWSEMSRDMDYYFIAGDNLDQVISGYRTLTGGDNHEHVVVLNGLSQLGQFVPVGHKGELGAHTAIMLGEVGAYQLKRLVTTMELNATI